MSDAFPAPSSALTPIEYDVPHDSPVTVVDVEVVSATAAAPR
jgi:hypothetical protein